MGTVAKLGFVVPVYLNCIPLRIWCLFSFAMSILRSLIAKIAYFGSHAPTSPPLHPYARYSTIDHVMYYLISIYVSTPVVCGPETRFSPGVIKFMKISGEAQGMDLLE